MRYAYRELERDVRVLICGYFVCCTVYLFDFYSCCELLAEEVARAPLS